MGKKSIYNNGKKGDKQMILLKDVADVIRTFGLTENVYSGKMPDKKERSIGVYNMRPERTRKSVKNPASYEVKAVSILVHWSKSQVETETVAIRLQGMLKKARNITVNEHFFIFADIYYDEPVPVDTDENGIYEYVIEGMYYFKKG